eukprot:6179872-Pleurochrysis_carterae.AAC.2
MKPVCQCSVRTATCITSTGRMMHAWLSLQKKVMVDFRPIPSVSEAVNGHQWLRWGPHRQGRNERDEADRRRRRHGEGQHWRELHSSSAREYEGRGMI